MSDGDSVEFEDTFERTIRVNDDRVIKVERTRVVRGDGTVKTTFVGVSDLRVRDDGSLVPNGKHWCAKLPSYVSEDDVADMLRAIGEAYNLRVQVDVDWLGEFASDEAENSDDDNDEDS